MATWNDVAGAAPDFAARAQALFDAHKHKTIATLRRDGSPRISGIEAQFFAGDLWFGSMPGAMKARDLQRDPRFALHSASVIDGETWTGDAKLAGRATEITDPAEVRTQLTERGIDPAQFAGSHFFRADLDEVVITSVVGDQLRIEHWRPGHPLQVTERT